MIRPLRRTHRWLVPAVFLLVAIGAVLAIVYSWPHARMEALPAALLEPSERHP